MSFGHKNSEKKKSPQQARFFFLSSHLSLVSFSLLMILISYFLCSLMICFVEYFFFIPLHLHLICLFVYLFIFIHKSILKYLRFFFLSLSLLACLTRFRYYLFSSCKSNTWLRVWMDFSFCVFGWLYALLCCPALCCYSIILFRYCFQ